MSKLEIKEKIINVYSEVTKEFISSISNTRYDGIPEPFLPVFGANYSTSKKKIVFVGIETKGYGNITDFIKDSKSSSTNYLFRGQIDFDNLEFLKWGSNFGNDFWGFVLQFLASFYNIENISLLRNGENSEILRSFVWGNSNSIERYDVSAKHKNVNYEDWVKVKESSLVLDRARFLLDIFSPDIMIILNWSLNDKYFEGLKVTSEEELEDHLLKLTFENYTTKLLWTTHPNWLNKNKDFKKFILKMVEIAKD